MLYADKFRACHHIFRALLMRLAVTIFHQLGVDEAFGLAEGRQSPKRLNRWSRSHSWPSCHSSGSTSTHGCLWFSVFHEMIISCSNFFFLGIYRLRHDVDGFSSVFWHGEWSLMVYFLKIKRNFSVSGMRWKDRCLFGIKRVRHVAHSRRCMEPVLWFDCWSDSLVVSYRPIYTLLNLRFQAIVGLNRHGALLDAAHFGNSH